MSTNTKKKQGNILIILGLLLIAAALAIVVRNVIYDFSAGNNSEAILSEIHEKVLDDMTLTEYKPESVVDEEDVPDYVKFPDMELPVGTFNGIRCVGILSIPAMEKEFPLIGELNDDNLRYGPCLYTGSPYRNNLVVGAHNNSFHFGGLIRDVVEGDKITVIDMSGNIFNYTVQHIEVLSPFDTKKMIESDWDLSLFTCTWDLGSRYTVRCTNDANNVSVVTVG